LSLPGVFGKVTRPKSIQVEYLDEKGRPQNVDFRDFDARIIQHEVDHLNGVLFIDYLKGKN
jgi:peptide deformylase